MEISLDIGFVHLNYPKPRSASESSAATDYIRYINDLGHNVTVYCPETPKNSSDLADDLNTHMIESDYSFPNHKGEELNKSLLNIKNISKHDVIHGYTGTVIPSIGKLSQKYSVKSVITLNAYNSLCPKNDLLFLDTYDCDNRGTVKCSACVSCSTGTKIIRSFPDVSELIGAGNTYFNRIRDIRIANAAERHLDHIDAYHVYTSNSISIYDDFGYPTGSFYILPIPLDCSFQLRRKKPPVEPYRLLYVGQLSRSKGVDRLPEILDGLVNKYGINIEMTIVGGGGDLENRLKPQFEQGGLGTRVSFLGYVPNDNLPNIYESHDLFVYPGRVNEAFGRIFLESLASSTPIVSTDVGSVDEIIGDGGVAIEYDRNKFVNAIRKILNDNDLFLTMSDSAYYKSRAYRMSDIGDKLEQLYLNLYNCCE